MKEVLLSSVRINSKMFSTWKHSLVQSCREIRKFWSVPKDACPNLDSHKDVKPFMEDLITFDCSDVPSGFDPSTHWLADYREHLSKHIPKGSRVIEVSGARSDILG